MPWKNFHLRGKASSFNQKRQAPKTVVSTCDLIKTRTSFHLRAKAQRVEAWWRAWPRVAPAWLVHIVDGGPFNFHLLVAKEMLLDLAIVDPGTFNLFSLPPHTPHPPEEAHIVLPTFNSPENHFLPPSSILVIFSLTIIPGFNFWSTFVSFFTCAAEATGKNGLAKSHGLFGSTNIQCSPTTSGLVAQTSL